MAVETVASDRRCRLAGEVYNRRVLDTTHPERPTPDGPVNLRGPVLAQIGELGSDYHEWVHRPIRVPSGVRIFRSDRLERLSRNPWWVVPLIWAPVVAALAISSIVQGVSYPALGPRLIGGLIVWMVIEYVLHRFVFHYRPRSAAARRVHFLLHGVHHLVPEDPRRLVFPPVPAAIIAATLFGAVRLLLPLPDTCAVMAGLLTGYISYDLIHYYVHHGRPRSRVGRFLQRYHLMHHFTDPTRMFGVSQPLLDLLGGTFGPRTRRPGRAP